ncbi:ornithine cyclodeaminase [Rheinheimera sp. MMS21-TC3]|uniref:ornithine cyclodeaminase n=1 Tax=Rheinheimera sp. MMS21-TC3 TaxID=3072790 RepID=UPI0028C4DD08|nr:ornithine cyclodeaminase [Rheinheimera sp. MMS21-TC3]WNO61319.1 ornithine cyclodeaminase [Rheinheimera sp. MMS21-TC3]
MDSSVKLTNSEYSPELTRVPSLDYIKNFIIEPKKGVPFVSVAAMAKLINNLGIETSIKTILTRIESDYKRWHKFEKSARYASHSKNGVIELMPVSDGNMFACKYVNGHPINTKQNLQTVAAFGILADVATGYPILLSEMCVLTALRTAATSAMVAKYCAPSNASTVALIGNGAQSEFQALAMKAVLGIRHFKLYDVDKAASQKTYNNLQGYDIDVVICSSAAEAVQGAQIITTCTADKKNATILHDDMIGTGVFINAIGGDCPGKTELDSKILQRADKVFVEFEPQTRVEGEIQQLPADFAVTEFYKVVQQNQSGRDNDQQLIVFDGVGFASEDFSALVFLRDLLVQQPEHLVLDLITQQADPRNLFSVVRES